MSHMPVGMLGMFVSMVALAVLYAYAYRDGSGQVEGARFGVIIAVFALGAFVLHNYVNLNIGLGITLQQCVMYFIQWTLVGVVIGLIYRPAVTH
jgi:branched-subunit amino acid transport protein AzlD